MSTRNLYELYYIFNKLCPLRLAATSVHSNCAYSFQYLCQCSSLHSSISLSCMFFPPLLTDTKFKTYLNKVFPSSLVSVFLEWYLPPEQTQKVFFFFQILSPLFICSSYYYSSNFTPHFVHENIKLLENISLEGDHIQFQG